MTQAASEAEMPSAADIAARALEEEERPKREALKALEEKERAKLKRRQAATERTATARLKKSAIPQWFPGVEWKFIERHEGAVKLDYRVVDITLDVWSTGDKLAHQTGDLWKLIRLGVRHGMDPASAQAVMFLEPYPDSHFGRARTQGRWTAFVVHSAADVARQQNSYISRTTPPDWA